MEMAIWDGLLSDRDKAVFAAAGFGGKMGFGKKPVILVVDIYYGVLGDKPEPILESIKRFRLSCGEEGWAAVEANRRLLEVGRAAGVPVVYVTRADRDKNPGGVLAKNIRSHAQESKQMSTQIVAEIAPKPGELVIYKERPSAFFGTNLISYLVKLGADSLIVTGATTSGCIRATVVDAYSYNFKVALVQEAVFDRGELSHRVNLFDMNAKYADVISLDEALAFLQNFEQNKK